MWLGSLNIYFDEIQRLLFHLATSQVHNRKTFLCPYFSPHLEDSQGEIFMFRHTVFCERLKTLRLSQNLTLEQLASELNLVKQTIVNREKGIRTPSLEASIALAEYFNVSLDYLVGLSDSPQRV